MTIMGSTNSHNLGKKVVNKHSKYKIIEGSVRLLSSAINWRL
jgi:uncharacterized protein YkvS